MSSKSDPWYRFRFAVPQTEAFGPVSDALAQLSACDHSQWFRSAILLRLYAEGGLVQAAGAMQTAWKQGVECAQASVFSKYRIRLSRTGILGQVGQWLAHLAPGDRQRWLVGAALARAMADATLVEFLATVPDPADLTLPLTCSSALPAMEAVLESRPPRASQVWCEPTPRELAVAPLTPAAHRADGILQEETERNDLSRDIAQHLGSLLRTGT